MRVCIVTPYDLSCDGGVNRHATSLARALAALGHHVRVAGPASGAVPEGCDALGSAVPVAANGSVARVGLLAPERRTRDLLAAGRFDVVHVHEPLVPGPARHALRVAAAPVVATFHCAAEDEPLLQRAIRLAGAAPLARVAFAIAVSRAAKRFARAVHRGRIAVVPNGVDTARFAPAGGSPRRLPGAPLRLLFVGRFGEPRKGFRVLLDAVALLRRRGIAVALRVAGDGGSAALARRCAAVAPAFLGRLSDAALAAEYRAADVFCAPSLGREGFGLVLLEAMASGCPAVASDIPGYAEAARGAALLVPPGDADALADALVRAAEDRVLRARLVAAGCARAEALSWSRIAGRVAAAYRAAGAAGAARPATAA
ncbi:MAG TPA: glycosyltransferase family 4 protein [Anaeromyxobacter sp.]|nr:glycosyltransferase family 4 protein [Anaeromyxobacter sp.]